MGDLTSNPYANVDWAGSQVTGLTHAHVHEPTTTGVTELEYFDALVDAGYRWLAISNYSVPEESYPLTNLNGVVTVPDDVIGCPNAEHFGFNDAPGHLGAPGSTFTMGTWHTEFIGGWKSFVDTIAANMQYDDGGGITINHPAIDAYVGDDVGMAMIDYSPLVLGIEIYDGFVDWSDEYELDGLSLDTWHRYLVTGRQCFGFAVPDHWLESNGHPEVPKGCIRLLVPSSYSTADRATREHLCQQAIRNGEFYAALSLPDSPVLINAEVTGGQFVVEFESSCDITFYYGKYGDTDARTSSTTTGTTAAYTLTGDEIYVRAEGLGSDGYARSFTNAVMFEPPFRPLDMKMVMAVLG